MKTQNALQEVQADNRKNYFKKVYKRFRRQFHGCAMASSL